jgi:hypothetical protein
LYVEINLESFLLEYRLSGAWPRVSFSLLPSPRSLTHSWASVVG